MNSKSINRIPGAFAKQDGKKAFIAFITGGDPDIETSEALIRTMAAAGADMIEIGIPFSDPIAEGPTIQAASQRALAAGCTVEKLFAMVARLRQDLEIPLLFMTYANPVFAYGSAAFMRRCREVGIDGLIVPDVPFEERAEFAADCRANGVALISMVSPTSAARAAAIAREAEGFLYCVSSLGVTGERATLGNEIADIIQIVRQESHIPCAIGFGISTPAQAKEMAAYGDGVIVGSAIVRLVAEHGRNSVAKVHDFVRQMKQSL